jgi:hypothetical protein
MSTPLSPWQARIPGVNLADGTFSPAFLRWLQRQLIPRVGGTDGLSNEELAALVSALSADVEALTIASAAQASALTALTGRVTALEADADPIFQPFSSQHLLEMTFQA